MLKKFTKNQFYCLVVFAATLFSTYIHARELPGNWEGGLQLGIAYDSTRHQEIIASCVAGNPVSIGEASGELLYTSEASFEKIVKAFDGSVSLDVKAPFVKAKASFEYARENASTDNRMNWFFEFNATRKSTTFALNGFGLSDYGREAIQDGYAVVPEWCGDEFVSKVDYGASLVGTMSVEFASKEDKESFKLAAALDVDFMVGRVQASAEMSKMQQKMGSRTIVKVHAHQKGGNPGNLNGILGNAEIVRCRLSDMDNCLRAFENILRYANGDFKEQLRNENGYDAIRFHTTPYKNSAARRLVPPQGLPVLERTVLLKRKQIQEAYERELAVYTRAGYVNTRLEHFTPARQLVVVRDIIGKSWANILELTTAMEECLQHPNRLCLDYRYDLQTYDKDQLEVKVVEQLDPNSSLGKLHKAVMENNIAAAYQMIRFGGNQLITQCDPQGFNACHRSVEKGHTRLLSLFVEEDPCKDLTDKRIVHTPCDNAQKYTPLHLAAEGGTFEHVRCMDLLCVAGAGVDCKTASGLTPLQVAVSCGNLKTTIKLISQGANINVQDEENHTLLHLAAAAGSVEIIEYLVDNAGLYVNGPDNNWMKPLHFAASAGHLEAVNRLLSYGANHQAQDRENKTALHWGIKHTNTAERLLQFHVLPIVWHELLKPQSSHGIEALVFSPDGSKLAYTGIGSIVVIDINSGAIVQTLGGRSITPNYDIAYNRFGTLLAGHEGAGINIWQPSTGNMLHTLTHQDGQTYLDFSPDGLTLASSHSDGKILLWDAVNGRGQPRQLLAPDNSGAKWLKFSPDGAMIATYGKGVTLWNSRTGARIHQLDGNQYGYGRGLAFSPDGSLIAVNSNNNDRRARVWNTQTGALVKTLEGGDGHLAFSPDGSMLVLAFFNVKNSIEFRDTRTWKLLHEITGLESTTKHVAFNFDGSKLATSHGRNSIGVWNLRWDSILHHAVRGGNFNVVKTIVEKFPLLLFIRTPQGQSPLDLVEELLLNEGDIINPEIQAIVDYLRM